MHALYSRVIKKKQQNKTKKKNKTKQNKTKQNKQKKSFYFLLGQPLILLFNVKE